MSRNRRTPSELLTSARTAIAAADWSRAEALLLEHARVDRRGDPESLTLFRKLEDGRGTRRATLARVTAFLSQHPDRATHPRVRIERGLALRANGENDRARAELLAARDALSEEDDPSSLALAEAGIGLTHLAPLDAERARLCFQASRAIAERAGLADQVAFADNYLAHVEIEVGELERAARKYRSALEGYERLGDEAGVRHASYNLGMCLHELGRDRAARRHLERAKSLSEKRKEYWFGAFATLILGELERGAGRLEEAERCYASAEEAFTRLGGPTPTEKAWVDMRRADLALDRGDYVAAQRLARAGLDPRVEPTPRMLGRLTVAMARARRSPTASAARALERVARDAETMALNEIAWRARTVAAKIRLDLAVERRLDGERGPDPNLEAVRAHVLRARSTLEGTMGAMRARGRGMYLRDRARIDETRVLLTMDALMGSDARGLLSPSLDARAAWLRMLRAISAVAAVDAPVDVARGALDAILEIARARRGHLWLDPSNDAERIEVGRDLERRDLPPRKRPEAAADRGPTAAVRVVEHRHLPAGTLLLEEPIDGRSFDEEHLELVDALATVAAVLVDAARARAHLLARAVARDAEARELSAELARTEAALGEARTRLGDHVPDERAGIIGASAPMRELFTRLDRLRATELPVLISGESGTGKELVARAIHDESPRGDGPFVAINCGALAEGVLESELFGHVRGAFSGAHRDAPGLFVVADKGTLLLDEIGEMSVAMQAKLLRVLQEGEVRPVGAERARKVNVRVLAATHRDLDAMVRARTFREDLFYRLHVVTVHVPPLRARGDDVVLLARRFLGRAAPNKRLGPDAAAWLLSQTWPGNVRELRAVVEAAAVLGEGDVVHARELSPQPRSARSAGAMPRVPERLADVEAFAIARALERHGSRVAAARALGIGRATLYRKMVAYGLT